MLLEYMENRPLPAERRKAQFKDWRAMDKVLSLTRLERRSGWKQLIDFLDEQFGDEQSAAAKMSTTIRSPKTPSSVDS